LIENVVASIRIFTWNLKNRAVPQTLSMSNLSRRDFLKLGAVSLGSLALRPLARLIPLPDFPQAERLGRVNVGKVEVKARPDVDSQTVGVLYEDAVVDWLREVVGSSPYRTNQRFVETPDGYIWAPYLQPARNSLNQPVKSLPDNPSLGKGVWVEVSVPYVNLVLDNSPARSPGFQDRLKLGQQMRLYYTQIVWIDQVKTGENDSTFYRVNEKYGAYGDILWGAAEAFRPITSEEIAPINPQVENKRVVVNLTHQALSCFEGNSEVYFTRISSGAMYNSEGKRVDVWGTPVGKFPIWRKLLSLHMSGCTTGGGWDLPGVGWTSLFVGSGVAIHSTYWHNNFGEPMSRGCVNASPEDSKWIFRWTQPIVSYDPGDRSVNWPGGTTVEVKE
jgi:lipoprotein-anchoring transpeptidase ErfK/SrfK